jgi:hypothetical protein
MSIETTSDNGFQSLPLAPGLTARVKSPGMTVAWESVTQPANKAAFAARVVPASDWESALAANGMESQAALRGTVKAVAEPSALKLTQPDSPDAFAELLLSTNPGEGLLISTEVDGVRQWIFPTNPPATRSAPGNKVRLAAPAEPAELRFLIPQSYLHPGGSHKSLVPGADAGVMEIVRFKWVDDLLDRGGEKAMEWIGKHVETKQEGFRWFKPAADYPYMRPEELAQLKGRTLILVHGIFSSVEGAFKHMALTSDPVPKVTPVFEYLRTIYGKNIIGWDHWTIGRDPFTNAQQMLEALPAGLEVDILCHSRGALVVRAALEHPKLILDSTRCFSSVGKAIFVAGACQGSQLAEVKNVTRLLNVYSAFGSIPALGAVGVALKVLAGVLKVVAHGAVHLPSIAALSPDPDDNKFLGELNQSPFTPTGEIVVAHANYDPSHGIFMRLLDLNLDFVFRQANDLVVPFTGVETFDRWQTVGSNYAFGSATAKQDAVMHTTFFQHPDIHQMLQTELLPKPAVPGP